MRVEGVDLLTQGSIASMDQIESVCQEAHRLINGERQDDYGGVKESFGCIAALWSPILGVTVTAEQVALCMIQLKIARFTNGGTRDSLVDICGYSGCIAKLRDFDG